VGRVGFPAPRARDKNGRVHEVDTLLEGLDRATASHVEPAVEWLLGAQDERLPLASLGQVDLQYFLWHKLPANWFTQDAEHHEIAWSLGDFFEAAGMDRYAAICRDRLTHEILAAWHRDPDEGARRCEQAQLESGVLPPDTELLAFGDLMGELEAAAHHGASVFLEDGIATGALDPALRGFRAAGQRRVDRYLQTPSAAFGGRTPLEAVWQERADSWRDSFRGVPAAFWDRSQPAIESTPAVPAGVELAVAPALALLEEVGEGVTLTEAGYLPPRLALALDERFGWSQDYPLGRPRGEADLPQLRFLDDHLRVQRLLTRRGKRLSVSAAGHRAMTDPSRLWAAVVAPAPRWRPGFEQDALAVLAACLLRGDRLTADLVHEEMTFVLGGKWRPADGSPVDDDVRRVEIGWRRLGLALGWWEERRRGPELRLSAFGRAAAASVFRTVATGPMRR
jgi:hypothetical protein